MLLGAAVHGLALAFNDQHAIRFRVLGLWVYGPVSGFGV